MAALTTSTVSEDLRKEFFKCASSGVLNLIMIPEHKMKRELTCTDLIFLRLEEFLSGQMKGHIVTKSNRL